jgi:hypothetical protein
MKILIIAVCFALLASAGQGQIAPDRAQKPDFPGPHQYRPDSGSDTESQLKERIRKLESLVAALQHENDLLKEELKKKNR